MVMATPSQSQLDDKLSEVQGLLDQLEGLIRQQAGGIVGTFDDLVKGGEIKLSEKEAQARRACQTARDLAAVVYKNGRNTTDAANREADEQMKRAKYVLDDVITLRVNSYTRAQDSRPEQPTKKQAAIDLEARQAKDLADLIACQAQDLIAREEQGGEAPQPETQTAHQVQGFSDLTSEDVSLAIASLAMGFVQDDRPVFSVAQDDLQQAARNEGMEQFWTCFCRPNIFILPIMMEGGAGRQTSLKQTLSAVGHLVPVVAERTDVNIHIKTSNSVQDSPSDEAITEVAKSIIRHSGWMGAREPHFVRHWRQHVPQQTSGTNSCGLHVILFGWAYILRMIINPDCQPTESLYRSAVRLVNKALRRQSSAGEIQQWMVEKGFGNAPANDDLLSMMGRY